MRDRDWHGRFLKTVRHRCSHARRKIHGRGLCGACYQRWWLGTSREAARKKHLRYKKYLKNGSAARATWRYKLKRRCGLSEAEYDALLVAQHRRCAICRSKKSCRTRKKKLAVDHDHKTKKPRGLLCDSCNRGLGMFRDNPVLLETAVKYLLSYTRV